MASKPLLSVYMPVYNAGPYLGPAIESVLDQTFGDFEFLIVDDGSTDGSAERAEGYTDPRIRVFRQENRGCYPARNLAIAHAAGKYLANMDADDISLPERFEKQIGYLERHEEAVLVGTKTYECDKDDTFRLPRPDHFEYIHFGPTPHVIRKNDVQASAPFTLPSILFRRSLVEEIGAYDETFFFGADLDFVARAALVGPVGCLPDYLYVLRVLPTSISSIGSSIQGEVNSILAGVAERSATLSERKLTDQEKNRLNELMKTRQRLPEVDERKKEAAYENRLATLFRVNGYYRTAMKHAARSFRLAPEQLFLNRKLLSNILKAGLGIRPEKPLS